MKISKEFPPNIKAIRQKFNLTGHSPVFTYGDTIYSPHSLSLPEHLIVHEEVHQLQQGEKPDEWWDKYLKDDEFRLSQELQAYQVQYRFIAEKNSRQVKRQVLSELAKVLSSQLYGNIVTFEKAKELISA